MNYNRHSSLLELQCSLAENEKISNAAFSNIGFHFNGFRNRNIIDAGNELITRKYIAVNKYFRFEKNALIRLRIPDSVNTSIILAMNNISIESIPLSK